VSALLCVSIIGITFVYGFNLETSSWLDNISALVRALGVDGGFFLGLYFSRRLWMRQKHGWWDGLTTTLFGLIWFAVALLMATLSWFSNTLFVASFQAVITQELLAKAGFTGISPQLVNKVIGAIPLVIVLLYSIVPRHTTAHVDTRTSEEIEAEARREASRIRAQNLVAAARAEGAGARLRTIVGGLAGEAFNLEERRKREERRKQMRIALETAGFGTAHLSEEDLEIQAVARGVWDQETDQAIPEEAGEPEGEEMLPVAAPPQRKASPMLTAPPLPSLASKPTLSVLEASQLTLRKARTISDWIKTGKITRVRKSKSGAYRIPRASLVAVGWIDLDGNAINLSHPEVAAITPQVLTAPLQEYSNGQLELVAGELVPLPADAPTTPLAEDEQA
jgi:hypothetical protein